MDDQGSNPVIHAVKVRNTTSRPAKKRDGCPLPPAGRAWPILLSELEVVFSTTS